MFSNSKITELRARIDELEQKIAEHLDTQHTTIAAIVDEAVNARLKTVEEQRTDKLSSDTPYFEIVTEIDIDDKQTRYELDWNPAFIKELKSKGYVGATDQMLIQKWIETIASKLEEENGNNR